MKNTSLHNIRKITLAIILLGMLCSLTSVFAQAQTSKRIVSINGTVSEILCELGFEKNIVGVDVTSTYPETLKSLPKVGHNRNLNAEGIISLNPSVVIGTLEDIKPEVKDQLVSAGVESLLFKQDFTIEGTKKLINDIAIATKTAEKAKTLIQTIDADLAKVKKPAKPVKVLFIYARGAGAMSVCGKNTSLSKMIELAGGTNVVDFEGFKPLTAEALVAANPDIILMFESGLKSIGGADGMLAVQGIAQTNAGKNKRFIEMDGQYLAGFGPRVGKALAELAAKLDISAKP